jgi:polar amino acid transport system substrate-binding protein
MGLEAQYVQTSWNDLVPGIEEGTLHILASARSTTPDNLQELLATDTYLAADLAICSLKSATPAGEDALKGKIVGVQLGTPAQTLVEQIDGISDVRTYTHILRAFDDLNSGELDVAVADEITTEWILENSSAYGETLRISGRIETGEGYAFWCAKKNQELLTATNTALAELRAEDVYQKICRKWGLTGN